VNPVDLKALEADMEQAMHSASNEYVPKTEVRALIAALRIAVEALDCVAKGRVPMAIGLAAGFAGHSRRFAEETLAQIAERVKVAP
jgi:hypothetical protein